MFPYGEDHVEVWDAQDFDPWTSLRWETVRVIFYRQNKPNGTVVQAYWMTDFSIQEVDSQALFGMAKSRWEIENQGFNEAKNLHGLEHYVIIIPTACWSFGSLPHWPRPWTACIGFATCIAERIAFSLPLTWFGFFVPT